MPVLGSCYRLFFAFFSSSMPLAPCTQVSDFLSVSGSSHLAAPQSTSFLTVWTLAFGSALVSVTPASFEVSCDLK